MDEQDKKFLATFSVVLAALVALAVFVGIVASLVSRNTHKTDTSYKSALDAEVAKRIAPVGQVTVVDPNAPPPAAKTPDEVVAQVCGACHATGAAGAPKIGVKADWEPRYAQGFDVLVQRAIDGIRAMPPRGGNPSLTDDEIRGAVKLILEKSEIAVDGGAAPAAAIAPATAEAPAVAEGDAAHGKTVYDQVCTACHSTGAAGAPKVGDKAAWAPRIAQGFGVLVEHSLKGFNVMPAKGGNPALADQDVIDSVTYMVSESK